MRRQRRLVHTLCVVLFALVAGALAACGSSDESSGSNGATTAERLTPVKVGVVEFTGIAPTQLGIDAGIFERHGIELELVPAETPAAISAQVLSGQLDLGFATTTYLITAAAKGAPLKAVSAVDGVINPEDAVSAIVVRGDSPIRSPRDLTGKKVAVIALASELDVLLKKVVDDDGGDASRVQSVQIPFPQMQAALKAGRVDAIVTTQPFLSLSLDAGGRVISEPEVELLPRGSVTAYTASERYIADNEDVIERFQAAMAETLEYARANREEALAAVSTVTWLSPEEAEGSALGTLYEPKLDRPSIETMQDFMLEYGVIEAPVPVEELVLPGA